MARSRKIAIIWPAALLVLGFLSANGAASHGAVAFTSLAPADEYFGREKLSPIGIRHKIYSLKDDLHHARAHPDAIEHDAQLLEDALRDWFAHFPQDPWLPSAAWNLATLYEELPGTDARTLAVAQLRFVQDSFANTPYAQYASRDLTRGVGVRPWPRWAGSASPQAAQLPRPSATPAPSPQNARPSPSSSAPAPSPLVAQTPNSPGSLVAVILAQHDVGAAQALEKRYWVLSKDGSDPSYARAAWELAALYERLPGDEARNHAVRLLALLVDRDSALVYGRWAMRDLERGIGLR